MERTWNLNRPVWHTSVRDDEMVELEQIESKHPTIENDLESSSKCENDFENKDADSDRMPQSPNAYSDGEALTKHLLVRKLQMQRVKEAAKKKRAIKLRRAQGIHLFRRIQCHHLFASTAMCV